MIETEAQNVSAYIPTNLISITDGQVYLSPKLFRKGVLPAVDVGRSVSRVGGKAQQPAYRDIASDLRLTYSQFEEVERFARFSTQLDEETKQTLNRGRRIRETLKQPQSQPLSVPEQIASLAAVTGGAFDDVPPEQVREAETAVQKAVTERLPELCERIIAGEKLTDEYAQQLRQTAQQAVGDTSSNEA